MSSLLERLGPRIRRLRTELGLSQRELAERSGLSPRFVLDLEKGAANVSVARLEAIAEVLGLEVYALLRPAEPSDALRRLDRHIDGCSAGELEAWLGQLDLPAQRHPIRVTLLGMRGAGKSTVGRALARRLEVRFVELDSRIEERAAIGLADIFSMHGPEYYEELELDCLDELLVDDAGPMVLATGGGLVTHPIAYGRLREATDCVYLKAGPRAHWQRVMAQGDLRPMEGNPRAYEQLCSILEAREPLYARADLTVDTEALDVDAIVERVAGFVTARAW